MLLAQWGLAGLASALDAAVAAIIWITVFLVAIGIARGGALRAGGDIEEGGALKLSSYMLSFSTFFAFFAHFMPFLLLLGTLLL